MDIAAREYFDENHTELRNKDAVYKDYLRIIKQTVNQKDKNTLSFDNSIKNLLETENVEALLGKLAHGSIRPNMEMILNLSEIIAPNIKKTFFKVKI